MIMLHKDEAWLKQKYIEEGLSLRRLSELCGVSAMTIFRWIKKHGIKIRDKNDYRKRKSGMTAEEAFRIFAEDTLVVREELLPDPEALFPSEDKVREARAIERGVQKKRERAEERAKLKRENEERDVDIVGDWHRGDIEEEMMDIQEAFDEVGDSEKRLENATKREKAHIERRKV